MVDFDELPQTDLSRRQQAESEKNIPPEMARLHRAATQSRPGPHEEISMAMSIAAPNIRASLAEPGPQKIKALRDLIAHLTGMLTFAQDQLKQELAARPEQDQPTA